MTDGLGDWRIAAATRLTADVPAAFPGGPAHKAGTPIYLSEMEKGPTGEFIGFTAPSAAAMAISIAVNSCDRAVKLKEQLRFDSVVTPRGPGKSVRDADSGALFDYFETAMETIVFSYLSLECFCNQVISREMKGPIPVLRRGETCAVSPIDAERALSTSEKAAYLIPKIRGIESPKGRRPWAAFRLLQRARDACVHMKSSEQYSAGKFSRPSLFFYLLHQDCFAYPNAALEMLSYFHSSTPLPRWLALLLNARKGKP